MGTVQTTVQGLPVGGVYSARKEQNYKNSQQTEPGWSLSRSDIDFSGRGS